MRQPLSNRYPHRTRQLIRRDPPSPWPERICMILAGVLMAMALIG